MVLGKLVDFQRTQQMSLVSTQLFLISLPMPCTLGAYMLLLEDKITATALHHPCIHSCHQYFDLPDMVSQCNYYKMGNLELASRLV